MHKQADKNKAKELYVIEGKKLEDIAETLHISPRTLYQWKTKEDWDRDLKTTGNIALKVDLQRSFEDAIRKAIDNETLTDAATVDSLYKMLRIMEKLAPQKVLLSNIFNMLQDVTDYFRNVGDDKLLSLWVKYLPEIGSFLRKKYSE